MAHIGRGVAVDAGAPMTAAYGADGHSHQRASSAEGSESLGGRSGAIVARKAVSSDHRADGKGFKYLIYYGFSVARPLRGHVPARGSYD